MFSLGPGSRKSPQSIAAHTGCPEALSQELDDSLVQRSSAPLPFPLQRNCQGFRQIADGQVGCIHSMHYKTAPDPGQGIFATMLPMTLIEKPTIIESAGNLPKRIAEFVGRVNTGTAELSMAHMTSPGGWLEPGQTPEFDEYTMVLRGSLRVETVAKVVNVTAGQAIMIARGEWVRYSTPDPAGAEYLAVCLPAFSPDTVNRDD